MGENVSFSVILEQKGSVKNPNKPVENRKIKQAICSQMPCVDEYTPRKIRGKLFPVAGQGGRSLGTCDRIFMWSVRINHDGLSIFVGTACKNL